MPVIYESSIDLPKECRMSRLECSVLNETQIGRGLMNLGFAAADSASKTHNTNPFLHSADRSMIQTPTTQPQASEPVVQQPEQQVWPY